MGAGKKKIEGSKLSSPPFYCIGFNFNDFV